MMNKISQNELHEILESYGIDKASYDYASRITPDSMVYVFSDKDNTKYVLFVADYLGGYENLKIPHNLEFDYGYPYRKVSFRIIKILSYKEDAKKKAEEYIDDNHYWTVASTGDICMLFAVDNLNI